MHILFEQDMLSIRRGAGLPTSGARRSAGDIGMYTPTMMRDDYLKPSILSRTNGLEASPAVAAGRGILRSPAPPQSPMPGSRSGSRSRMSSSRHHHHHITDHHMDSPSVGSPSRSKRGSGGRKSPLHSSALRSSDRRRRRHRHVKDSEDDYDNESREENGMEEDGSVLRGYTGGSNSRRDMESPEEEESPDRPRRSSSALRKGKTRARGGLAR